MKLYIRYSSENGKLKMGNLFFMKILGKETYRREQLSFCLRNRKTFKLKNKRKIILNLGMYRSKINKIKSQN